MRIFGLLLLLFVVVDGRSQVRELQLASDIWPPFTNIASEEAFAMDLVDEALMRSYIRPKENILEFGDVLDGLKSGKYDGSAALWMDAEREEYLLFSKPYLQNQLVLVGRDGADVSADSFDKLAGSKIAIVGTYAYGDQVQNARDVEFVKGLSDQENLERLVKGEVDYMLVDALLIQYVLRHQEDEAEQYLEVGDLPLITRSLHFAIRKEIEDAQEIIDKFNKQISGMILDGTYNEILQIHLITSDINGDGKPEVILSSELGGSPDSESYSVWFGKSAPTMSAQAPAGYYIDGKYYDTWQDVPGKYKQPKVTEDQMKEFTFLEFNF